MGQSIQRGACANDQAQCLAGGAKKDLAVATKLITSTWACKKKSNGEHRARSNARGFMQIPVVHCKPDSISSPVASETGTRIMLVLMIVAKWHGEIIDAKGAFLTGQLDVDEQVHMEVPKVFEGHCDPLCCVLLLLQTICGLKQSAFKFHQELLKCFKSMSFERCKADPCIFHTCIKGKLMMWSSWTDNCLCVGPRELVLEAKKKFVDRFDCMAVGDMNEYVGCMIEIATKVA